MSAAGPAHREVTTADGRRLTVELSGARHGTPVFLLHGTPGSRHGPKPRGSVSYRQRVLLITYDRPGYGLSTRKKDRRVADAAGDVATIADSLDLSRFAVVGRSGGGPHALACAALLPDRVSRTAVLVGLAPANAVGLDWFDGMTPGNVDAYSSADADSEALTEDLRIRADHTARDPESLLNALRGQLPDADRRVVDDVVMRRLLAETYTEAVRSGPYGWVDDVIALRREWGFPLHSIATPVRIWHGAEDSFSPVSHAHWLATRIPGASVEVRSGFAHFGAMEILPDMLSWLTA